MQMINILNMPKTCKSFYVRQSTSLLSTEFVTKLEKKLEGYSEDMCLRNVNICYMQIDWLTKDEDLLFLQALTD